MGLKSCLAFALASLLSTLPALAETPKSGGTLNYAVTGEVPFIDCHATTTYASLHVLAPHYSLLLRVDPDKYPELQPDLADSWQASADGTQYTFKLRQGVLFHDGSAFSSADIKATFDRLRAPPPGVLSVRKALFENIVSIETPDANTAVFKLKSPEPGFLDTLALPYNCVYSAAKLAQDPKYPETTVMGTGPFVFVEHVAGSHWSGKKFDKYFMSGKPYLDTFRAQFMKATVIVNALQGGQIDAEFRSVTPTEAATLKSTMKDKVAIEESPWLCRMEVFFNAKVAPFDNPKVRQALSIAIDRWKASEALSKIAIVKAVGGPMRPGSVTALSDAEVSELPGFSHDMTKARAEAKRLLAEAGVPDLKVRLINRSTAQPFIPVGVFVVDQWRQIGVTAEHVPLDVKQQKTATAAGQYTAALDAFCGDSDAAADLLLMYLSRSRSPRNVAHNEAPELDKLFDAYRLATAADQQKTISQQMQRRIITDAYSVPVIWYSRIVAHSASMKGWRILPTHYANQDLGNIWLDR